MMQIPGANVYAYATRVLATTAVQYYKSNPRTTNSIGQYVSEYDSPITIRGSLQPVAKSLYTQLGLNLEKTYYNFYTETDVQEITRDISSDKFIFNGTTYKVESSTDWLTVDGWKSILAVMVPNDG